MKKVKKVKKVMILKFEFKNKNKEKKKTAFHKKSLFLFFREKVKMQNSGKKTEFRRKVIFKL